MGLYRHMGAHLWIWLGLFLGLMCVLQACGGTKKPEAPSLFEGMDKRTRWRMKSYLSQGIRLYEEHCASCHGRDGKGLKRLVPPLKQADYLLEDVPRAACIIRYGQEEEIWVQGESYHLIMPGNPQLKDIEIAEILTYITNAWGNRNGLVPVKAVSAYLDSCALR